MHNYVKYATLKIICKICTPHFADGRGENMTSGLTVACGVGFSRFQPWHPAVALAGTVTIGGLP